MARIFLSHSSTDNAEAVALREWLVAQGWDDLFLDLDPRRGIAAGERWEKKLREEANRCEAVLFLVSEAWLASRWCLREFDLARKFNKRVFGILIEDVPLKKLPRDMVENWQLVNLAQGRDHVQFTVALPSGEDGFATFSKHGLASLKEGLARAGLDPGHFAWPPPDDPRRPPYRGMRALESEDAGIFFGREAPVIEALDALRGLAEAPGPRLFAILGASGAGKSSFLRAGLIARLARDDRHFRVLPVVRAERAALSGETGLVRALHGAARAAGVKRARAEIAAAVAEGANAVAALLSAIAGKTRAALVLPIDQGEELFLAEGAAEARAFLTLLRDLLGAAEPRIIALIAIRSDAFERLQLAEALEGVTPTAFPLQPLPRGAYQTVIEGPALRLKDSSRPLAIDPALTAALLADSEQGGAKDALPLLAFTLERLYRESAGDGVLTLAEYRAAGGIKGAIEAAVEAALKRADVDPAVPRDRDARLALLRRALIPWLAGIDTETGAPRRRVARMDEIPAEARPLVHHLVEARLLATDRAADGATTVEPAHEALLRQWGLLQGWLENDSAALSTLDGVKRAALEWQANARAAPWLSHAAGRLEDAERFAAQPAFAGYLTPPEREYLATCRLADTARRDKELAEARKLAEAQTAVARRTRTGAIATAFLMLLALGAAYFAYQQKSEAETQANLAAQQRELADEAAKRAQEQAELASKQREQAILNETISLAALSQVALSENRPPDAVKLALAAWPRAGNADRPGLRRVVERLAGALSKHHDRNRFAGHEDSVYSAVFSPDGTRIVTASKDNTARLWDAKSGAALATLTGHKNDVTSAVFSPDGTRIVTASRDKTARLWDATSGAALATLTGHLAALNGPDTAVASAVFSPDGTRIVTASVDQTARLWDAKSGVALATLTGHESYVTSAVFSPDGKRIVTASRDNTARLWDAKSGAALATLTGHVGIVWSAVFSPDGTRIVTASGDKTARLWDATSGAALATLTGHESYVTSAVFSPDGTRVVTASWDKTARLWDATSGAALATLTGHQSAVRSAVFSPDGTRVVTASGDNTARLWDATSGAALATLTGHERFVNSAVFSPDGTRIVTASADKTARLWDAKSGGALTRHEKTVTSAVFSPNGTRIVTASWDKTARLWDAKSGTTLATLTGHEGSVYSAVFSPDGTRIVTASADKTARLWDATSGAALATLTGHELYITSAVFSPDGTRIVTASGDKTARLWDAKSGVALATLAGHESYVTSAVFSPDGTRVVTASWDKTARLWDATSGAALATLTGHQSAVRSAVFSPDGTRVVTASGDNTARLWDATSGAALATLTGHENYVESAVFSPDGARIVTASRDSTARLWDAKSGAALATLAGDEGIVYSAVFSPDGTRIVTASADKTARLWDAKSGAALATLTGHEGHVYSADFSPDGTRIVTASSDGTARIWDISWLEKGDAFAVACQRLGDNTDLADVEKRYGLAKLPPICGDRPPAPVDLGELK